MNRVAASEADQLTVARALVGQETLAAAEGVVRRWRNMPTAARYRNKIGPTAMKLLRDTLAKGAILQLARRGGWRTMRFVAGDRVRSGRMWERHPPQALRFSRFSIHLLRWLTESPIARSDCPNLEALPETPADELLMYLAVDLCRRMDCAETLARQPAFRQSGLVWLGAFDLLALNGVGMPEEEMFSRLLDRPAVVVLEALVPDLADGWLRAELKKRTIVAGQSMIRLGAAQEAVARAFLSVIDRRDRRDLAQCFIEAGARLLAKSPEAESFVGRLEQRGRIADRARARSAAAAFLKVLERLGGWAEEARSVRFFDEEYDAAQLYLSLFEPLGDRGVRQARDLVRALEALDATAAATTTGESS